MTTPTLIESIQARLAQTNDDLEKFHLLAKLSNEYKKMWKLRKALEISEEALNISQTLLNQYPKRIKEKSRQVPYYNRSMVRV